MSNAIRKIEPNNAIDSFDGFEDAVEGEAERAGTSEVFASFTNQGAFVIRGSDEELSSDTEYLVGGIDREVTKWVEGKPDRRLLAPGEKFPDIDKLNAEAPKSEWSEGPGGLRGPWEKQYLVRLLNPVTMERITFVTKTKGGEVAVRDLVDRTRWMRKYRGENVFPVVRLAAVSWIKKYGNLRPHFDVKNWVAFGGGTPEAEVPAIEAPPQAESAIEVQPTYAPDRITSGPQPKPKRPGCGKAQANLEPVEPPTVQEDLNDDLPF